MRQAIVILILTLYFAVLPAEALEFLMGTVSLVEKESGRMMVHPVKTNKTTGGSEPETSDEITVLFNPGNLPGCVEKGKLIRVWGDYVKGETKTFQARMIRGKGRFRGNDPTGVRCRIGKSRGRHGGSHRGRGCGKHSGGHQE